MDRRAFGKVVLGACGALLATRFLSSGDTDTAPPVEANREVTAVSALDTSPWAPDLGTNVVTVGSGGTGHTHALDEIAAPVAYVNGELLYVDGAGNFAMSGAALPMDVSGSVLLPRTHPLDAYYDTQDAMRREEEDNRVLSLTSPFSWTRTLRSN